MRRVEIARLLPRVFRQTWREDSGSVLDGLLGAMESLISPAEYAFENLGDALNPRTAPDDFVRYLTRWVLPEFSIHLPQGRLRELVALAAYLARWRGTSVGLARFLEVATGVTGIVIDDVVEDQPFHMRIRIPRVAQPQRELIQQIVEREKPAYMTWEPNFY